MKSLSLLLLLAMTLGASPAKAEEAVKKMRLRVLYVGGATDRALESYAGDSAAMKKDAQARAAAWGALLSKHFTTVKTMSAADWTQEVSKDYDVTVMDGRPAKALRPTTVDRAKQYYGRAAYLSEDFDLPMLTIGRASEDVTRSVGCKNDWYCLCLDADAHSWASGHAIFKGPFPVKMTVKRKPVPDDAKHYAYFTGPVPDSIPMWAVQTQGYLTAKNFCVGMVSRPWGYTDSPDAEYISSGVCAKTLDAVAIGRHGNFLHWGFAASPLYMTEEAKTVFANAVAYISKFKGQGIIARKYDERQTTLEYLKEMAYYSTDECYAESLKSNEEWNRQMLEAQKEAASKKSKGEPLSQYEEIALNYKPQPQPTREEFFKRHMKEWYDRFGADPEAFRKYLEDNRPYLYGGEGFYTIQLDEDCKRLGTGNHDLKLLDACISMLEKGQDVATARRLLARYTLCGFSSAAEWRAWFSKYKDKLFFSESADWVWLVDSREPGVNDYQGWMRRKTLDKVPAGETSDAAPVAVNASREFTEAGDQLLIMRVKIHPGYHIYAYVPENEAFNETEVSFSLPEGYTAGGALQKPFGKPFTGKIRVYEDEVTFIQPISGASKQPVKCEITYQCCDSQICFPPETKTIEVK